MESSDSCPSLLFAQDIRRFFAPSVKPAAHTAAANGNRKNRKNPLSSDEEVKKTKTKKARERRY